MSVIITFMFEPAKLQMNWASARGRINLRGDITAGPEREAALAGIELSVTGGPTPAPSTPWDLADHGRGPSWHRPGDSAGDGQLAAFFTSAPILASCAAVNVSTRKRSATWRPASPEPLARPPELSDPAA
jgi:hypothetical protein